MKNLNLLIALALIIASSNLLADFILLNSTKWPVKMDVGLVGDGGTSAKREVQPYSQLRVTNAGDLWNPKTSIRAYIWNNQEKKWDIVAERGGSWAGNREITVHYNPTKSEKVNEQFSISVSNSIIM